MPNNEDLEVKCNCKLRHMTITVGEICQPDWGDNLPTNPQTGKLDSVRAKSAASLTTSVPVLTNEEPLVAGEELVWRDEAWKKECKRGRPLEPVLVKPPVQKARRVAR